MCRGEDGAAGSDPSSRDRVSLRPRIPVTRSEDHLGAVSVTSTHEVFRRGASCADLADWDRPAYAPKLVPHRSVGRVDRAGSGHGTTTAPSKRSGSIRRRSLRRRSWARRARGVESVPERRVPRVWRPRAAAHRRRLNCLPGGTVRSVLANRLGVGLRFEARTDRGGGLVEEDHALVGVGEQRGRREIGDEVPRQDQQQRLMLISRHAKRIPGDQDGPSQMPFNQAPAKRFRAEHRRPHGRTATLHGQFRPQRRKSRPP
jgi:hypothetical protein